MAIMNAAPIRHLAGDSPNPVRDLATFLEALTRRAGAVEWYSAYFSPYPAVLPRASLEEFACLRGALNRALVSIVEGYLDDARLQRIVALPAALHRVLQRCGRRGYRVGSFRPDLLLDRNGVWRVCEINARFPFNSYIMSWHVNRILPELDYLQAIPAEAIAGVDGLLNRALSRLGIGPERSAGLPPVTLVKAMDPGREIDMFLAQLDALGIRHRRAAPGELSARGGKLLAGGEMAGPLILELCREELLDLTPPVIEALMECGDVCNDPRTLLLVHDKRMLAALTDDEVLETYVDPLDRAVLARHVIPTWNADDSRIADSLRREPERWVLKRNSSGRGAGMQLGWQADPAAWAAALAEAHEFAAQLHLTQQAVPIWTSERGEWRQVPMAVVGLLPGFDGELLGPGFFRASLDNIINLHEGRGVLVPAMVER